MSKATRPLQRQDAQGFIIPFKPDDNKLRVIKASNLIIYHGDARPSRSETVPVWCIFRETLDASGDMIETDFAEGTNAYVNVWDSGTSMAITGISQADPCVITVADTSTLASTDKVYVSGVGGMTEVNGVYYNITVINGTTLSLQTFDEDTDVDSSAYTLYTAGGTLGIPEVINYIYS